MLDVVDRAFLKKADLLSEIQLQGVMSDFSSVKAAIAAYPGDCVLQAALHLLWCSELMCSMRACVRARDGSDEELLIYSDKQQKYGEMWLLAVTAEARDRVFAEDAAAEAAAQAEQEAMERERMRKEEEEV